MLLQRNLIHIDTPQAQPGFLGKGHSARPLIQRSFTQSDPFILLMDDILDKKDDTPVGGPHPHAGFETVSLLIEGEMGEMKEGDFQMMTAGSGVIHTETIDRPTNLRLLQLWLNLPKENRWTQPRLQELSMEQVPHLSEIGVDIRLYSGTFAGLSSPVQNYTPMILAEIILQPGVKTVHQLPANFNTFLYVLSGSIKVGESEIVLNRDQVGWLNLINTEEESQLTLVAGEEAVRLVLYGGKPTGDVIVSHGPFIAGSKEDIARLYDEFRQGKMQHIDSMEKESKVVV